MAVAIWMMIVAAIAFVATLQEEPHKPTKIALALVCVAGFVAGGLIALGVIP